MTERRVNSKQVLDHGRVELLDIMGDDFEPARAARASYGKYKEDRTPAEQQKLMTYLYRNQHTTPFEMVELKWHIKCPVFVARQWLRHRTANVNEVSRRYTGGAVEFYVPQKWRRASSSNKQASTGSFPGGLNEALTEEYKEVAREAVAAYYRLAAAGVAREMARMVLPQSMYTEFIWKNDLHNTLHFLRLRSAEDAQWEIQEYARAMIEIMNLRLPYLMEVVW